MVQLLAACQPACADTTACHSARRHIQRLRTSPRLLLLLLLVRLQVPLGNVPGLFLLIPTRLLLLLLLLLPASLTCRWRRELKLVLLLLPHPHDLLITIPRLTFNLHSTAHQPWRTW
jgi:hypothetical protein